MKFGWKPALQHPRVQQKRSGKIQEAEKCQTLRVLPYPLCCSQEKDSAGREKFRGIFLVLLSLFLGCSREDKEEHAGSDISLPPESFRIVSVEPEDAAEQVSIQTSLKVVFNSEIDQEAVYPGINGFLIDFRVENNLQ